MPVAVVALVAIDALMSMAIFPGNAEKYSNVLKTDTLEFAQDIKEVNYSEIPVIDRDSAILLGNREMGSIPEYVSQFRGVEPVLADQLPGHAGSREPLGLRRPVQVVHQPRGRHPGLRAREHDHPGRRDRTSGRQPHLLLAVRAAFSNIDRHVQLSYPFYMFGEKSFEIDEDGHPWWICPVKDFTIGLFGGETISRVVLCDATTGETQDLAVADCPEWVDRVFPAELLIQQYNWWGPTTTAG